MPIIKTLIEMENTGYIPFKIQPVTDKQADDAMRAILTELSFIATCGQLVNPPDALVAVAAISPYPVSKTDYRRACAAARERLLPLIPARAACEPMYPIALRSFPFITDENAPRKRCGDPADRPLRWMELSRAQ